MKTKKDYKSGWLKRRYRMVMYPAIMLALLLTMAIGMAGTAMAASETIEYTGGTSPVTAFFFGQSFTPANDIVVTDAELYIASNDAGTRNVQVQIRTSLNTGSLGTSDTTVFSGTTYSWKTFNFSTPISLTGGTTYYLVIHSTDGRLGYYMNSSDGYAGGQRLLSTPDDTHYTEYSGDVRFRIINTIIEDGGCETVTPLDDWPSSPQMTGTTGDPGSVTFSISAGEDRLLVVLVTCWDDSGDNGQTFSATYGGKSLTEAYLENSQRRQTWIGYLTEDDIEDRSGDTVSVTVTGDHDQVRAYIASYEHVDQDDPITDADGRYLWWENGTNIVSTALDVNAGGYGIFGWSSYRSYSSNDDSYTAHSDAGGGSFNYGVASKSFSSTTTTNPSVTWSATNYASVSFITLNPKCEGGGGCGPVTPLDDWPSTPQMTGTTGNPTFPVAAVTPLDNWPSTPQMTGTTGNPASVSFSISAGTDRLLVVLVSCYDSGGSSGQTFSATYGGKSLTQAYLQNTGGRQTWIGYLKEADIATRSGDTVSVTVTGTHTAVRAYIASYEYVNQTTPITDQGGVFIDGDDNVPIGGPLNVNAGGHGIFGWAGETSHFTNTEGYVENSDTSGGGFYYGVASRAFGSTTTTNPSVNWYTTGAYHVSVSFITVNPITSSQDFVISTGTDRLLVVLVTCYDSGGDDGQTFSATYGGKSLTQAYLQNTDRRQTWIGYLTEDDISTRTGDTVSVTVGGDHTKVRAYIASYEHVDQDTPVTDQGGTYISNDDNVPIGGPLNVNAGGYGIYGWSGNGRSRVSDTESYDENSDVDVGSYDYGVASKAFTTTTTTNPTVDWSSSIRASVSFITLNPECDGGTTCATFYSSGDGYIETDGINYNTIHDAASGTVSGGQTLWIGQDYWMSTYYVDRAYVYFDTSAIPDTAVITSASMHLYGHTDNSAADFSLTIVNGQPDYPHSPLVGGDYDITQYTTSPDGGQFNTSGFSVGAYNKIDLNATGLGWINKTGTTKLGIFGSTDISENTPSSGEYVTVRSSAYAGTDCDPYLEVCYTTGGGKTDPTLSVTNSPQTYNGSPQAATVEGSVTGTVSDIKYNGSSTDPTNAGTYAVTADFVPDDTTNYNSLDDAAAGDFVIAQAALTVTAVTDTKVYDGDTSSDETPVQSGCLAPGDTVTWTQTFDTRHVGTGKTLTPWGIVNDGNCGANYDVTFVNNTTGEITAKPLWVSADVHDKVYDGTTAATVTLSSSDIISPDTLNFASDPAVFPSPDVGIYMVDVTGITILVSPDAGNYALQNTSTTDQAEITPASATVELEVYLLDPEDNDYPNDTGTLLGPCDPIEWMDSVRFVAHVTPSVAPPSPGNFTGSVTFEMGRFFSWITYGTAEIAWNGTAYIATLNNIQVANSPTHDYTAIATFLSTNPNYAGSDDDTCIRVVPRVPDPANEWGFYTGDRVAWTTDEHSNTATVKLVATLVDTGCGADVTQATVTFLINGNPVPSAQNLPVGLVDPDDPTVGVAAAIIQFNMSKNDDSEMFIVTVDIGGMYDEADVLNSAQIMTVRPTKGGRIVGANAALSNFFTFGNAAGYLGDESLWSWSAFDISYNKALKNPQGKLSVYILTFNDIDGGKDYRVHQYIVTSNAIGVLSTAGNTAVFSAKCNVKEIMFDGTTVSIEGNAKLDVTMTDFNPANPGLRDTLAITVYKAKGGLWYSSNWNGAYTTEQEVSILGGGPDQLAVQ